MSKMFIMHPDAIARAAQLTQMLNSANGAVLTADPSSCHPTSNPLASDEHTTSARQHSASSQPSGDC